MELAGDASGAAIKSLLTKLGSLLAQEYALVRGVRGDVQFINDELASMLAFLSNLQHSNEGKDDQTEDWMKQVREVAYDIEDCIDDFTHSLDPDRRGDDCWSKLLRVLYEIRTCWPRRNIAAKIAQLKERARDVGERRGRYGVSNPVPAGEGIKNTMTMVGLGHGHYPADHQEVARRLVSIDKPVGVSDMHSLETWITSDENKKLGVLSISGFGGVGKTTAAMALYRSCGVKFMRRAMVTVSHSTDPDEVLKDILKQLKESTIKHQGPINSTGSSSASQKKKNLVATAAAAPRRMVSEFQSLFQVRQQEVSSSVNIISQEKIHGAPVPQNMMNFFHKHMGNLLSTIRLCSCGQHEDGRVAKEHEAIKMELREKLGKDRYLLLIDDVWSASTWQMIWNCLPINDQGSRVIVTTRFAAVANTPLVEYQHQHKMQLLSEQEAELLFNKSLSECGVTEGSQPTQKDQIPSRVWEMCGGLPLPIVTMAGLVASKPLTQKNEWTEVCNSLFPRSQVCHKPEEFMRIINYCYNVLTSDLKTCSLYLCIFPKGGKITRKRLIRRWIAEGFVSERQGLSVEDIAETCFNQLVERKIIRAVEHSSDGRVKSCQVHDMVLEFIISKASEENFVTVVGGQWSMPTRSSKVRRLSVHSADSKHVKEADRMNLSHVRSLTVFGSLDHLHLKSFKAGIVQVLDLERCTGFKAKHDNVSDICEMTLLKFLSLRRTDVRELPSSIGSLKYLETLDVRETKVRVLPASVGQLERISNILGGDKGTREALKVPREIKGTAKTLRVLTGIEIGNESSIAASDISYFTGLRKLAIYKLYKSDQMFKDLLSSIQYISGYYLQTLVIDDDSSDFLNTLNDMPRPMDLRSLELSGRLLKLPHWVPSLDNLIKLTLSATVLQPDNLKLLSGLRILFSLTFSICSKAKHDPGIASILENNKSDYRGEIFVPAGGFVHLKLLRIFIPLLPSLNFSEGAMPALERLELRFRRLEGLNGMAKLQSIHDVIITVDGKAGGVTKSILDDLKRPQSKYTLNVNELYD